MAPVEFKASLVRVPYARTAKGRRVAGMVAHDMPSRRMRLLRRFTGETLFEYLVASDEDQEEMMDEAWSLFRCGLIEPLHHCP